MGEINRLLGEAGAGTQFDAAGERWTLSPLTKGRQAEFEAWMEANALAKADTLEASGKAETAMRFRSRIEDKIAADHYTFGGQACMLALATPPGIVEVLRILLKPKHPTATAETVLRLMESDPAAVSGAVKRVVEDYISVRRGGSRPPVPPAEQATRPGE